MEKKLRELHQEVLKEEDKVRLIFESNSVWSSSHLSCTDRQFLSLTKEVIALEQDNVRNGRDRSIACTKLLSTEGA